MIYITYDQYRFRWLQLEGKDDRKPGVYGPDERWMCPAMAIDGSHRKGFLFGGRRWTGIHWARPSLYAYIKDLKKVLWYGDIVNPPELPPNPAPEPGYYLFDGRKIISPGEFHPWENVTCHIPPLQTLENLLL